MADQGRLLPDPAGPELRGNKFGRVGVLGDHFALDAVLALPNLLYEQVQAG